jgi:hypothetical protein
MLVMVDSMWPTLSVSSLSAAIAKASSDSDWSRFYESV